jgi:hypothetical protein
MTGRVAAVIVAHESPAHGNRSLTLAGDSGCIRRRAVSPQQPSMNRIALLGALGTVLLGSALAARSALHAEGGRGSGSSQGSATTTTSSSSKASGRTPSTVCFDANAATIACPTRP